MSGCCESPSPSSLAAAVRTTGRLLAQGKDQCRAFWQVALSAKPILHRIAELIDGNIGSDFEVTVSYWQRVVKNRCVGEVSHAEIVEPFQRAGHQLAFVPVFHAKFTCEHPFDLSTEFDWQV